MKVRVGSQELELGGKYIGTELQDSSGLLGDAQALRDRMAADGYLLLRGLQVRANVLRARDCILRYIQEQGALLPGTKLEDGIVNPEGKPANTMGRRGITHEPEVRAVLESKEIFDFFGRFLGKPPLTFDYKWLRCVKAPDCTGAHYDIVYMGRGSTANLYTVWTPMMDIPLELGPLAICAGSHRLPGFAKIRETYGRMDVDRDRIGGWFSDDPVEIVEKFGGRWQTTEFHAGDVIVFGMWTMHGSLRNATNRWRISCDTRFQPADEPVDERWIGENPKAHYAWFSEPEKMIPMPQARSQWGV